MTEAAETESTRLDSEEERDPDLDLDYVPGEEEAPPMIDGQLGLDDVPPEPDEDGVVWKGAEMLREHLVPIGELTPNVLNPRRGNAEEIAKSLKRFGQMRAVLTDPNGEIVAGHHVTKGAALCGWTHVAAMPATFKSREEQEAYLLADNQLGRLGYEDQKATLEMLEGQTTLDGIGFSEDERRLMALSVQQYEDRADVKDLQRHQRDPRELTPEQMQHLVAQLEQVGLVRNIIVARDGTILAGAEIVEAARSVGFERLPVKRMDIDPDSPEALKIMAADSEVAKIGKLDDRQMADLLREIKEQGNVEALVGTGHTAETLAAMVMTTRPKSEMENLDAAAEWVGLPEFTASPEPFQITISCETEEARDEAAEKLGLIVHYKANRERSWSAPYPPRPRDELKHLRFEG